MSYTVVESHLALKVILQSLYSSSWQWRGIKCILNITGMFWLAVYLIHSCGCCMKKTLEKQRSKGGSGYKDWYRNQRERERRLRGLAVEMECEGHFRRLWSSLHWKPWVLRSFCCLPLTGQLQYLSHVIHSMWRLSQTISKSTWKWLKIS